MYKRSKETLGFHLCQKGGNKPLFVTDSKVLKMHNLFFSLPSMLPTHSHVDLPNPLNISFLSLSTHAAQFQHPTKYTLIVVRFSRNKLKSNCSSTGILQHKTANIFEVNIIFLCQSAPGRFIIYIYPQGQIFGISNPRYVGFYTLL